MPAGTSEAATELSEGQVDTIADEVDAQLILLDLEDTDMIASL